MSNVAPPADDTDLRIADAIQGVGGIADFRLLRFAVGVADFSTGEAARAIGREGQSALDRRAERLVGTMLARVGEQRPKRYAATPQAAALIGSIRNLLEGPELARVPVRLLGVRDSPEADPAEIARILAGAREIYDADGAFALVAVYRDDPQLVRDLLFRLRQGGAVAEELRLASRRQ